MQSPCAFLTGRVVPFSYHAYTLRYPFYRRSVRFRTADMHAHALHRIMRSSSRQQCSCFGRFTFSRVEGNQPCVRSPACRRGRVAWERGAQQQDDSEVGEGRLEWSFPRIRKDGMGQGGTLISHSQERDCDYFDLFSGRVRITEKHVRYHIID